MLEISFLGYNVNQEGMAMDESKVATVMEWPLLRTVRDLQHFLGFANFWGTFIHLELQLHYYPLPTLLKKGPKCLA